MENKRRKGRRSSQTHDDPRPRRRSRKKRSKERIREIKHILIGNYITLEDGSLVSGGGEWISPLGVGDGAGSIIVLGLKDKCFLYDAGKKNSKQVMFTAFKAMKNIGRAVTLETAQDGVACYVRSVFFRPVVLVFEKADSEEEQNVFALHAYCGRSALSHFSIKRAVGFFEKEMPDSMIRS